MQPQTRLLIIGSEVWTALIPLCQLVVKDGNLWKVGLLNADWFASMGMSKVIPVASV